MMIVQRFFIIIIIFIIILCQNWICSICLSASSIKKLNESEESEDEAEGKAASEKRAAHSSGKKYVPPRIAPVHYGNDVCLFKQVFSFVL